LNHHEEQDQQTTPMATQAQGARPVHPMWEEGTRSVSLPGVPFEDASRLPQASHPDTTQRGTGMKSWLAQHSMAMCRIDTLLRIQRINERYGFTTKPNWN
jgi:hypothetical protein